MGANVFAHVHCDRPLSPCDVDSSRPVGPTCPPARVMPVRGDLLGVVPSPQPVALLASRRAIMVHTLQRGYVTGSSIPQKIAGYAGHPSSRLRAAQHPRASTGQISMSVSPRTQWYRS